MFFILIVAALVKASKETSDSCFEDQAFSAGYPIIYYYLVFGPSQFGKSTFINNFLDKAKAECQRAEVGDGSGGSVTIEVKTYTMKAFKELLPYSRPGYDIIKIFDVPGLFDNQLRIDKKGIFEEIKKTLLQGGVNSIDAFFIFESVKDDSRKINITFNTALEFFGESLINSSILITTKWDRLTKKEEGKIEPTIESFATILGIETHKWYINHEYFEFSDEQINAQFSMLGSKIQRLEKYNVDGMDDLLKKRDILAEQIRQNDPKRYATEEYEQEVQEAEEYIEDESVNVTEWVQLSTEEIESKAQKMYENQIPIPGGLIPRKIIRQLTKEVTEYIPEITTETITIKTGVIFKDKYVIPIQKINFRKETKNVTEDVFDYEFDKGEEIKLNLNFYRDLLVGQMKPEVVQKIIPVRKVRIRPTIKKIQVNHDRFDFEHYQKLAVEKMQRDFKNLFASK